MRLRPECQLQSQSWSDLTPLVLVRHEAVKDRGSRTGLVLGGQVLSVVLKLLNSTRSSDHISLGQFNWFDFALLHLDMDASQIDRFVFLCADSQQQKSCSACFPRNKGVEPDAVANKSSLNG